MPQGQGEPGAGLAGAPRRRRAWRPEPVGHARGPVRRPRRRAAPAQGPVPRDHAASGGRGSSPSSGPAGIGKTRLAWEFLKYIDGLVETGLVARRSQPGLRRRHHVLGARRDGPRPLPACSRPTTSRRRGRRSPRRSAEHVPDDDERRWIEPALLALLGIESGHRIRAAVRCLADVLRAARGDGARGDGLRGLPLADPGLIDFVDHLLEWSRTDPIYVVTLSRPELMERRPDWGAGKRSFTSLYLEPLADEAHARAPGRPGPGPAGIGRPGDRRASRRDPALCRRDGPDAAGRRSALVHRRRLSTRRRPDISGRAGHPDRLDRVAPGRHGARRPGAGLGRRGPRPELHGRGAGCRLRS